MAVVGVLVCAVLLCGAAVGVKGAALPVRTYDQRQQGELNIHAQLDNIVIVLVPSSNIDLFGLKGVTRLGHKPNKDGILQFLQKPHKNDIDRYEFVKDENDNDVKDVTVLVPQDAKPVQSGDNNSEKEEEVVATVEEMRPDTTGKPSDLPKPESTEPSQIKENSTVSESVKELILKVSVPENLKSNAEPKKDVKPPIPSEEHDVKSEGNQKLVFNSSKNESEKKSESSNPNFQNENPMQNQHAKEIATDSKSPSPAKEKYVKLESTAKKITLEDLIKPVAAKEVSPTMSKSQEESEASKVEGARREKVIRYKPETKWAPGLVDMLTASRAKSAVKDAVVEERQRFATLCAPGSWDTELQTCIMPGETRSRHELARFLEAMRFAIAVPSPTPTHH